MANTARGEQTRAAIVEAALRLFRENGYEATTMRAIAKEAGVATGNAYYYYASKEELVREYFALHQAEHAAACRQVLAKETRLGRRITGVLRALVDVLAPCRGFAAKPYWQAAEPAAVGLYAEVMGGARGRIPASGRGRLPELLWLYSMGIVLYWVHDTSPGCVATYRLIDSTAPIAARLIRLAWLPGLRSVLRQLLSAVDAARRPLRRRASHRLRRRVVRVAGRVLPGDQLGLDTLQVRDGVRGGTRA
ncbi:MAG: TetR family transcriptional regulator [Streptosporangiaceae bacterium]